MAVSPRFPWVVAIVLVLGIVAAILVKLPPGGNRPPEEPPLVQHQLLDRTTSVKLMELQNLGLVYLENHQFDDAFHVLEQLLAALPFEPFAVRNLAIARVKHATEKIDERLAPETYAQAKAAASQAIQELAAAEPQSALPDFLRAVLATKGGDSTEIARHLRRAAERQPENAAWKFQWFELGRSLRDPPKKAEAYQAGLSAASLAPDNLFVQKEVLAESLSQLLTWRKPSRM